MFIDLDKVNFLDDDFDITPDPRVLPMLGEINLAEWRCLAELIDNSVDGFLAADRAGFYIKLPQVTIATPFRDEPTAKVAVKDNGPGMDVESLERAVRAGFSNNDPINNLGLFGMGFNIATARLGSITRIFSARSEDNLWTGLEINFEELSRNRSFRTPRLTRPKIDPSESGTLVEISHLKPSARSYFANAANRTRVHKELGRVYSSLLRPNGIPIHFLLKVNNNKIRGREHCVWGDERGVEAPSIGYVSAFQTVEANLGDRKFCTRCWYWLGHGEESCQVCGQNDQVVMRARRVHGWLGLQRYTDSTDFGIDILRNGRKIEIANKDLFSWAADDTESPSREYPIDDPRNRGRIVGEIHLDHCRVTYAKDRFDRSDVAWNEMMKVVRGEGPLQPRIAADLGYTNNISPLGYLYRPFRRNTPHGRAAGSYAKLLIVKDNDRAKEMAKRFHDGEAEYQDDQKWWELVQEADRDLLIGADRPADGHRSRLDNFDDYDEQATSADSTGEPFSTQPNTMVPSPPLRRPIVTLSQEYLDDVTQRRWEVEAFSIEASDPALKTTGEPWVMQTSASGISSFYVNPPHSVFRTSTLTPLDALLIEMTVSTMITLARRFADQVSAARVLASLRRKYAKEYALDPVTLSADARQTMADLTAGIAELVEDSQGRVFFEEFSSDDQAATQRRMANLAVPNPQAAIDDGRFLEYAPRKAFLQFFERHPAHFFDRNYWNSEFSTLDYGDPSATGEARAQLITSVRGLLTDAIWLEERDSSALFNAPRPRLIRAASALQLLQRQGDT